MLRETRQHEAPRRFLLLLPLLLLILLFAAAGFAAGAGVVVAQVGEGAARWRLLPRQAAAEPRVGSTILRWGRRGASNAAIACTAAAAVCPVAAAQSGCRIAFTILVHPERVRHLSSLDRGVLIVRSGHRI